MITMKKKPAIFLSLAVLLGSSTVNAAGPRTPYPPVTAPPPRIVHGKYCDFAYTPKKLPVGVPPALSATIADLGDDKVTSYLDSPGEVAALITRFQLSAKRWDGGWGAEPGRAHQNLINFDQLADDGDPALRA